MDIINELRSKDYLDDKALAKIIHTHNRNLGHNDRHYSKKKLLPYYLKIKESNPDQWEYWDIDEVLEKRLVQTLQMKPRRTASGVATITVITKPWKCTSNCLYCPNDIRMPKSYLSDEPACQRAERNYFDPYLQVVSRIRALTHMGHVTDKIELIILGGTWSDYPQSYQIWFISELFRALNDGVSAEEHAKERRKAYKRNGIPNNDEKLHEFVQHVQENIDNGTLPYNEAFDDLYLKNDNWNRVSAFQTASLEELYARHASNEEARHRVVGLVIETRPDTITPESLTLIRQLGCTKVQIGIQSLDRDVLRLNNRSMHVEKIQSAFELLRLFGFKVHAHFMQNLYGSSVKKDKLDYHRFVHDKAYQPDEVKLYPCSLVKGTKLCELYASGSWKPYSEEELVDLLSENTIATPPFTRISRMIRDISAHDIVAGNKKTNLRQMVEGNIGERGVRISEIRHREISTDETVVGDLTLDIIRYETTVTDEYFLQWITPENKIVGFLRLSLPHHDYVQEHQSTLPIKPKEAMIREVHIYGKVAQLSKSGENAQHLGLGKRLIETAGEIAQGKGYTKMNVISSIGTREYYRSLGFKDMSLYQQKPL